MESVQLFLMELFGYNPHLATIILSMFPGTEARLGIPFGMNTALWGTYALSGTEALLCGFLGSSLVVPLIAILFKPVLKVAKKIKGINKLFFALEEKLNAEKETINDGMESTDMKSTLKAMFGVFLFVLTPLPLTGVYTGTMLGVILNLGFWKTCVSVILGNFFACLLVGGVSSLINTTFVIIFVVLSLVAILLTRAIKRKRVK